MNLLEAPWMPVRRRDGTRAWVPPSELSDPALVSFDADRSDFNGALAQFAIGLLQTTSTVDSPMAWGQLFNNPPRAETLRDWFRPVASAFQFNGGGARFMQDFELRSGDGEPVGIGSLLIDSPGENALRNNGDHFVKRGQVERMCTHCVAAALFTLQINAPAGGAGIRTGLRGGGPLTTLVLAQSRPGAPRGLWHNLWLNVLERRHLAAGGGDDTKVAPHFTFPWLTSISSIQKEGGETTPIQMHSALVYWAMPRRIRLDFEATSSGACDLCGRNSEMLLRRYVTRKHGLNFKGHWMHPLSPHYETEEGWLPVHPRPGGIGYRHWLGWVFGNRSDKRSFRAAAAVAQHTSSTERKLDTELLLWSFGFDMDKMKARCWYEATLPLYALSDCSSQSRVALKEHIGHWLAGAELAASLLRGAVKDAWFGGEARGDFSFVDASFWSCTERPFYELLRERIETARDGREWDRIAGAQRWQTVIRSAALSLFEGQFVGAGPVDRQDPARIAQAHRLLSQGLSGSKMREALDLPPLEESKPKSTRKAAPAA